MDHPLPSRPRESHCVVEPQHPIWVYLAASAIVYAINFVGGTIAGLSFDRGVLFKGETPAFFEHELKYAAIFYLVGIPVMLLVGHIRTLRSKIYRPGTLPTVICFFLWILWSVGALAFVNLGSFVRSFLYHGSGLSLGVVCMLTSYTSIGRWLDCLGYKVDESERKTAVAVGIETRHV